MSSNETVTRLAQALAVVWCDLMSEDFRGVSPEIKRIEIVEEAKSLGVADEVYSLANRILTGTN